MDAEHAFSVGRLEVSHIQHNTSPRTFNAQVAVGSWAKTPLNPGLSETIRIVEGQMQGESQSRAGDEVEVDASEMDDEVELSNEEAKFFT